MTNQLVARSSYGSTVNADLLKCFPKNAISTVARVGILLSVTGSYPIFMYIVRKSVCKMVYGLEPNALPLHKFLIVRHATLDNSLYAVSVGAL